MADLPAYHDTVRPEWIDYNSHMSEAFYVLVFGFATDQVMDTIGMDDAYRGRTGSSLYTVEAHIRYLSQARLGEKLTVTTTVVAAGAKKLHLAHEMKAADGELVATEELLALHIGADERTEPFGDDIAEALTEYTQGRDFHPPDWIGRAVQSDARRNPKQGTADQQP